MTTTAIAPPLTKRASTDFPIHELLARRWSPYGFADRDVSDTDLCSLFEAARWAASSYNEQPWTFLVATRQDPVAFARLLACLVPANQVWAKAAPVLILGVVSLRFEKNHQENRAAVHDLGLASANLVTEATSRGLAVHQMIGILPMQAREFCHIPEHFEAWTALAIGYMANADDLLDDLRKRDLTPRSRKPTGDFVFASTWGKAAPFLPPAPLPSAT